jgi:hypothetical protein
LASQPETFLFEAHPIRNPAKARQSIGVSVMTYAGKKTAFVFTGGGSLGAIQVGMLCVLLGAGVWPDFVVGASVGALNASYFTGAPDIDCVTRLEVIWHGLKRSDIFPFSLATAVGLIRHPDYLVDPGGLRGVIEANLPFARLEDAQIPLSIIATNLQGQVVRLSKGPRSKRFWPARRSPPYSHPWRSTASRRLLRRQHADAACGRARRRTDHRAFDRLRLCTEGAATASGGQGVTRDHPDDCLAAQA